jgi:hypothetical protein
VCCSKSKKATCKFCDSGVWEVGLLQLFSVCGVVFVG